MSFQRVERRHHKGNSGNRALCSNRWFIRGTLLQSILDNWTVFQELLDGTLEAEVN